MGRCVKPFKRLVLLTQSRERFCLLMTPATELSTAKQRALCFPRLPPK